MSVSTPPGTSSKLSDQPAVSQTHRVVSSLSDAKKPLIPNVERYSDEVDIRLGEDESSRG